MYKFNGFIGGIAAFLALIISVTPPVFAQTQPSISKALTPLQQQLNSGNWKAADIETRRLIQQWIFPKGEENLYSFLITSPAFLNVHLI